MSRADIEGMSTELLMLRNVIDDGPDRLAQADMEYRNDWAGVFHAFGPIKSKRWFHRGTQ